MIQMEFAIVFQALFVAFFDDLELADLLDVHFTMNLIFYCDICFFQFFCQNSFPFLTKIAKLNLKRLTFFSTEKRRFQNAPQINQLLINFNFET